MKRALALAVAGALLAACGGNDEQQAEQAKQAQQSAEQTAQTAEQAAQQAAKGLEDMARGLESLAGGGGGSKPVDPVSFRDLMALLPELDGFEKEKPTGERMTSPVSFSQAEGRYTKGDASIDVKIIDSGFNQLLLTPYAMFLAAGYERETSEGHEKSTKVNGQPGWEKWNSDAKDGEVNALVGKRFLVTIDGNGIEDVKVLHDVAARIDMGKLAALK
jgi:hypothetical protein